MRYPILQQVFNQVGQRIRRAGDVQDADMLFLVPPDRLFLWPTIRPGRKVSADYRIFFLRSASKAEPYVLSRPLQEALHDHRNCQLNCRNRAP